MGPYESLIQERERFIMDLSFALGIPAHEIDLWPESQLQRYLHHSQKHPSPIKRNEYYQVQLAYLIATTMGGYEGDSRRFYIDAAVDHEAPTQVDEAQRLAEQERMFDKISDGER
ncbi:hypothetical protein [Snodgrassella sp. CFCC 13594]|uniref:hypothetical protein n=1 Tax=Snodgrassella sp. CFCC 13594 TaxID=1775559 RepID=UPI00082D6C34|nr:hypothetical protein [Snodgrassella sp. CFCC 13594]